MDSIVLKGYRLLRCTDCGTAVLNGIPDIEEIKRLYQENFYSSRGKGRFRPFFELLIFIIRWLRARDIERFSEKGAMLDVGFSRGMTLSLLKKRGWEVYGTQISKTAVESALKKGIDVFHGELVDAGYPSGKFDIVTLWHVLEHLSDPVAYISEINRVLKMKGRLIIEVPNFKSAAACIFKEDWFSLDVPRHIYHFAPESLRNLLTDKGFRIIHIKYFSIEHSPFSMLQSFLNSIFSEKNLLFEYMKRRELRKVFNIGVGMKLAYALAVIMLILPATAVSLILGIMKKGDIITVYAEKVRNIKELPSPPIEKEELIVSAPFAESE